MKEMGSEPEMRPIEPLIRSIREVWEKAENTLRREVLSIVLYVDNTLRCNSLNDPFDSAVNYAMELER